MTDKFRKRAILTIEIEKGVPIPKQSTRSKHYAVYPWKWMGVGDSFTVPVVKILSVDALIPKVNKTTGKYFRGDVDHKGDYRVWRVK